MNSSLSNSIQTPWPNLRVYADSRGEIDPHSPSSAPLFRGEEAFADDMEGWRRWSKPSPEPALDAEFEQLLLDSIEHEAPNMAQMSDVVANQIADFYAQPVVLVGILRAGVPVGALLASALEKRLGAPIPLVSLSLFHGLGWDEVALQQIIADYPNYPIVFVDGWTSGGGVATELADSFARWQRKFPDFTNGNGPKLAVFNDPRGVADFAAVRADVWVPSALFTAPQTLGFSRGFANENGDLFGVYTFPSSLLRPRLVEKWLEIAEVEPAKTDLSAIEKEALDAPRPPANWRVHGNEVVRALINRAPQEVLFARDQVWCETHLKPMLHLCRLRGVPVKFDQEQVRLWGALAAARLN